MAGFDYPVGRPDPYGRISATETSGDSDGYFNAQDFGDDTFRKTPHLGEDWNGDVGDDDDIGDPIHAVSDGTVRYAGNAGAGWGNVIIIDHTLESGEYGGTVSSMYAHLNSIDPSISVGTDVDRGQIIGELGDTGLDKSDPLVRAHLHFEMRSDETIVTGPGYSADTNGWIDPSEFIDDHRPPATTNEPSENIGETPLGQPPSITGYDTFQEGDLIFLRLHYTDPDGDAEGFGFRGVKGSGWAEETHSFTDPSYGRVSPGKVAYPFNHLATSDSPLESDVEAWIYDKEGLRSDPVTVHLKAESQDQKEVSEVADPIPTDEVPFFILGGSNSELDPIGGTAM